MIAALCQPLSSSLPSSVIDPCKRWISTGGGSGGVAWAATAQTASKAAMKVVFRISAPLRTNGYVVSDGAVAERLGFVRSDRAAWRGLRLRKRRARRQ